MSPPPKQETEDYWTSHASHGSKKKHQNRAEGASRLSPFRSSDQYVDDSAAEPRERSISETMSSTKMQGEARNTSSMMSKLFAATDEPQEYGWFAPRIATQSSRSEPQRKLSDDIPNAPPEDINETPAITSLRRLSAIAVRRPPDGSPITDATSNPLSSAIKSLLKTGKADSQTRKQSIGDQSIRRRSSAFRDGDRRRPKHDDAEEAVSGLAIPAVITVRKPTGLFQWGAGHESAALSKQTEEAADPREGLLSSPTSCCLIAFDSQQIDSQRQAQVRKHSVVSTKGVELAGTTPGPNDPNSTGPLQQDSAAPAITVANIYPSPAILVSPIKVSSPIGIPERRFSVVQINSRKSVHQVIWCEDDSSGSNGTSSDPISPTEGTIAGSVKIPSSSENSPVDRSAEDSKAGSRRKLKDMLHEEGSFPPDVLVDNENDTPVNPTGSRPQGQMIQWSWGIETGTPVKSTDGDDAAKPSKKANEAQNVAPPAFASSVPQLMIPDEEEPTTALPEVAIARRGSFLMDPARHASIGAGRELGSRRSISINPLALSRFAKHGADDEYNGGPAARRHSRVA